MMHRRMKSPSLKKQNDLMFRITLSVSLFLLITILSVVASFFYLQKIGSQADSIMKELNALAIELQKTPAHAGETTKEAWERVVQRQEEASRFFRFRAVLSEPRFTNTLEGEQYRIEMRAFASRISFNRGKIFQWNQIINLVLLAISFSGIVFQLTLVALNRRSLKTFLSAMEQGISSIDDLLQFKRIQRSEHPGERFPELIDLFTRIDRVTALINLDHDMGRLSGLGNMDFLVDGLSETINQFMPCQRLALAFRTSNSVITAETVKADYSDLHLVPGHSERIDAGSLHQIAEHRTPRIINNLPEYAHTREVSVATKLLLKEGIFSSVTAPLVFRDKCVGFIFVSTRENIEYHSDHARELARIASAVSHTLYTEFLFQETVAETTRAFVSLMSEKDNETSQHLVRMARYSFIVARKYNQTVRRLEPALLREILWFAPLHDIGKIGITDLILHKTGPLTDDERKTMQTHVFIGERVLREMDASLKQVLSESLLKTAIEIIGGHHEKFDGSGYPRGLAGENIPLAGRIVAAADVFDALTSKRPYKDAWPVEKAVSWMKNSMPGHFDPEVFGCLEASIEDIMMVYEELKEV